MDVLMSKRGVPAPRPEPKAEKPRGGRARAVSELLPDIGRAAFRKFGFVQSAIVSRWPEIVGTRYAGVSAPNRSSSRRASVPTARSTWSCAAHMRR